MVILLAEKHGAPSVATAVAIAALTVAAILSVSPSIFAFLGRRGALAMERLMGMLLVMLSVQMIFDGIDAYLKSRQ